MEYFVEKKIGEHNYTIKAFPPKKAMKIMTRLLKICGESFSSFADLDRDPSEVLPVAVKALLDKIDEDSVEKTVEDLCSCLLLQGRPIAFEVHFQKKLGHLFKVLFEVIKYQYEDFFDELPIEAIKTAVAGKLSAQSGSTGTSGDQSSQA